MSDSDNYFSDTDKSENEEDFLPNDEEESEDDGFDEETRRIIYDTSRISKLSYEDISTENTIKKKKKIKKQKEKKHLTLLEFESIIEKPKRWKGKRFQEKKQKLGITKSVKVKKRCFNPRLPPPTFETFKNEKTDQDKIDVNNDEMFPTLKEYDV
jgi:hypothetical protein